MQQSITLRVRPSESTNEFLLRQYAALAAGRALDDVTGFHIEKKSVDARSKQVWINLTLKVFIQEPFFERSIQQTVYRDTHKALQKVIIIGGGPSGLFAALKLIEEGIQPVILERGKDVRARRRDLAALNKDGVINPDSNYCFGEGGAGTYSDGKLYTRSNKRGDINKILNLFVQFGAEENILFEAHPHIGTNKLPQIITNIRQQILSCGGVFLFNERVVDLVVQDNHIMGVKTAGGSIHEGGSVILATGHSARDVFQLLCTKNILIEFKPFALGVRVEHPQQLIDSIQYHCSIREEHLAAASYSLVQQVNGKGVFSFCMCPGGIIACAATNVGEIVVNGWSPSKRNNPYANSGIVVTVDEQDLGPLYMKHGPLAGMYFQQSVEQRAYTIGGGALVAPAQRMTDFVNSKASQNLPGSSYIPGLRPASLNDVLPDFISNRLRQAFTGFGKKMKGYMTNEAVLVATESRTSSTVRIPRHLHNLQHPQIKNLYPCGEGAGYAGGIISAAMDGEHVAKAIIQTLKG
ncbi:MAG: FAD-dependent protein [Chitinophagaceae bacterium]